MSGASNTSDIDEDHHIAEKDHFHVSRGIVPWFASQTIRQVYTHHMTTTTTRRSRVTDKSRGECAGCCTCWVDMLLDTRSNEPLGIINYAILWARAALQRHSLVLVEDTRIYFTCDLYEYLTFYPFSFVPFALRRTRCNSLNLYMDIQTYINTAFIYICL